MRLSKVIFENIKSFKDRTEILFSEDINIFIGPNGGGKSNLMNTLSWVLNSRFYSPYTFQFQGDKAVLQVQNYSDNVPEPHWSTPAAPSYIWIEFVATEEDIEGLRDSFRNRELFKRKFEEMLYWEGNQNIDKEVVISDFEKGVVDPEEFEMQKGDKFRYKISIIRQRRVDALLVAVDAHDEIIEGDKSKLYDAYLRYLTGSELRKTLREEKNQISLPYILYPPNRTPHDLSINLSGGYNFFNMAQTYRAELSSFVVNGGGSAQVLSQIASTLIGVKLLDLIHEGGFKYAIEKFRSLEEFKELNDQLSVFGFRWVLEIVNQWANHFQVHIAKAQEDGYFSINQASSGERQLLNFIFGLSTESVKNSLIIIDEPELNLHPRWQKLLLRFFLRVQSKRKSQFILSTHSASFLDDKTLPHVRRIYRRNQSSAISSPSLRPEDEVGISEAVKLLNAQQNERTFFTQKAVLVEGQSDYVIWQKLINIVLEVFGVGEIVEVIEVLGSANFKKYRNFLGLFEIENYIIADQDYVMLIGDEDIKKVFKVFFQENKACQSILKTHSLDRQQLISALELAIQESDFLKLEAVIDYLKCRHSRIEIDSIKPEDLALFDDFRAKQASEGVFVLRKGALEAYYLAPNEEVGALKKDTDKAIAFSANNTAFGMWIAKGARSIKGENLTKADRVMAGEAAEFISIAMRIVGVEITTANAEKLLDAAKDMVA